MDAELDKGATGPLWLRDPRIAGYVEDAIFHGEELNQYELDTYVVMPNHVHVLLWPRSDESHSDGVSAVIPG
jgi:REP element-mobilizing transposase RayT